MNPMRKKLICMAFFGMAFCAGAQESTVNSTLESIDSVLDYKIGTQQSAGRRIGRPAIDLNYPKAGWNVGASCSGWSADAGVSGLLNDAESQFNRLQRRLVNSLTGFVTQLPMLLIQREDPGMYELLNSTLLNGEDMFDARVATCRQMSERFAKNGSMGELQDTSFWMEFSEQERQQRESGGDLTKIIDQVEENKGEAGVIGMGGERCGGKGQAKCAPLKDAAKDGFERLAQSPAVDDAGNEITPWHKQIWKGPDEATAWIQKVVGDVRYATCKDCDKLEQTPGIGVYDDIADGAAQIRDGLMQLVDRNDVPKATDLKKVSANDLVLNEGVIMALRAESVQQATFVQRLAEDIALLKTVDKLLAARRILLAGKSDPNFNSTAKNIEVVDAKIRMIADEISMIKEELELKKVARGDTLTILLGRYESRRSINTDNGYQRDTQRRVVEGVKKSGGGS